jgi:FMN-dependent NADH-azoreductase
MKRLLHISASPRKDRSRSAIVAAHFLARLQLRFPNLDIEQLDLFDVDLPPFDQAVVDARYHVLGGGKVDPAQEKLWQDVRLWADQFLSFDSYLIATPMWNFGIPYPLKHYIDIITQPGMTFRNDRDGNVEGLAKGRRAFIVAASAMPFGSVAELDGLDFQLSYLKAWLGFIGVTDVDAVRVAGTFGSEDAIAEAMSRAHADATRLADTL